MSILAHQFHPRSIRVEFGIEVSTSALNVSSYQIHVATLNAAEPEITSADFYDSTRTSVVLGLSSGLTLDSQCTLNTAALTSASGDSIPSSSYNFVATVPDKPEIVGAFLSLKSQIDVVFDRPVNAFSPNASANLTVNPDGGVAELSPIWSDSVPNTTIRFEYSDVFDPGSEFIIDYQNVCDESLNPISGSVRLVVPTRKEGDLGYDDLSKVQITDAWVECYVPALQKAYVTVTYNAPLLQVDATNPSSFTVDIPTNHLDADTTNVPETDASDTETLLSLATDLKAKFNAHVFDDRVHLKAAPSVARIDKLIRLTNELWKAFNTHILDTNVHLFADSSNITTAGRAYDLDSCIDLLQNLRAKYNSHITGAGVHPSPDTHPIGSFPSPPTMLAVAEFADKLRFRMQMHFGLPFHTVQDTRINGTSFCLSYITSADPASIFDAEIVTMECQYKFAAHAVDKTHLFRDSYNSMEDIVYPTANNSASAINAINNYRSRYYNHIVLANTVELNEVYANLTDEETTLEDNESSYQSQYAVYYPALPESSFTIFAGLASSDSSSTTNPDDYTGQIVARSLQDAPKLLQSYALSGKSFLKFDKEISTPRIQDIKLQDSGGQIIRINSIELYTSVQSLYIMTQRLAHAFGFHNDSEIGAVHKVADSVNTIDPGEFLGGTMENVYDCLNELKTVFNSHATDLTFHEGTPSSHAVETPNASDESSAIRLAYDLFTSLRAHNLDGAHHSAAGKDVLLGKMFDTLVIHHDEIKNGTSYSIEANLPHLVRRADGPDEVNLFVHRSSFTATSQPPFLAAALPRYGLSTEAGVPTLVRDRVDLYFSKPMLHDSISAEDVTLTPSADIGKVLWTGSQTITVEIGGTTSSTQYDISVSDVRDKPGNSIE